MIQDIQPTKTILCKFQQTLAKGTISHRGATLRANVEQRTSKTNPIMRLASNTDHFCCCNMKDWPKNLLLDTSC